MKLKELREMFEDKPRITRHIPATSIEVSFKDVKGSTSNDFAVLEDFRTQIMKREALKFTEKSAMVNEFLHSPSPHTSGLAADVTFDTHRTGLLSSPCDGVLSPCGEVTTKFIRALPMHTRSGEAEDWYLCERCEKEYNETWKESCFDWDILVCENCKRKPARTIPAMTHYSWDGSGEDPNRPLILCFRCARDYVEHWTNMWGEYVSTRF